MKSLPIAASENLTLYNKLKALDAMPLSGMTQAKMPGCRKVGRGYQQYRLHNPIAEVFAPNRRKPAQKALDGHRNAA